ncbi:MAG TPA: peptide ABC transporter permease [Bacillus sp. (in: firmicutes)]|uniref:peptide ABC transporter permease n=1 Tax=Bacillus litorisediminis TaxID=2922713 RepID=UPI001FADD949|nr:peptide ABC transporter permease [Bacillus litorisediminis]HWO75343.1 peptide ABC transporter permease [Bacillus sp. (in: firmicutes)]
MKLWFVLKHNLAFFFGLLFLLFLFFITFIGPSLPFIDEELKEIPYKWNEERIPVAPPYPPSDEHLLGTDRLGRDMLSLLVMGARETLMIVILITIIRYLVAIPLAFLSHKKLPGAGLVLHWLNGLLSYVPTIVIVILLAVIPPILTADYRPTYLILIIATVEAGRAANMIKLEFDDLSAKEFMLSGVSSGARLITLFKAYYLPFLYLKVLTYMITDLGRVMFLLGQLGFIGIFISQDLVQIDLGIFEFVNSSISWPMLLMDAFRDIRGPIWIPFFSALAMTFTIFTFNLLAQGIQNFFKKKVSYL